MKVMDPQKSFCEPLGVHGPPVGNHWCRRSSLNIRKFVYRTCVTFNIAFIVFANYFVNSR